MKLLKTVLALLAVIGPGVASADSDGVVYRDKNVRFTVVTDGLLRMEYSSKGRFADDRSFVAYNRTYPDNHVRITV